jgi:hypothetical protein
MPEPTHLQALAPHCMAELEQVDKEYDEEQAKNEEMDTLLQTLARAH